MSFAGSYNLFPSASLTLLKPIASFLYLLYRYYAADNTKHYARSNFYVRRLLLHYIYTCVYSFL
jgi:hypothetical protein